MLSTVREMVEGAHDPEVIFIKVLVLTIISVVGMYWIYHQIKNH